MNTLPALALCAIMASVPAAATTAPSATAAAKQQDPATAANALLDLLDAGRFQAAHDRFAPDMAKAVDAGKLATIWKALPEQFGEFQQRGPARVQTDHGMTAVTIPLVFAKGTLDASVVTGSDGRVAGFWIKPAPPPPAAERSDLPSREVSFGPAGRSTLPGTLLEPKGKGPFPAVVFVHGSGPNDRDETVGGTRVFADLANGLADAGIASLRYDKRTKVHPNEFGGAYTVDDEVTADAVAAVAFLRQQPGIDPQRIYVVGHSLGAMMAPRIAQKAGAEVKGIVLLAAPARHLEDILVDQNEYLAAHGIPHLPLDALKAAVAQVKQIDAHTPPVKKFLLDLPASYWLSLKDYDDIAVAKAIPQPLLIEQGLRDFQVTAPDWKRWRAAFGHDPRATFHDYPTLSHLFVAGSGPGSLAEYAKPAHVDVKVIADIAAWIKAH